MSPLRLTDPHHMVIKPFVLLDLQISTVDVINIAADRQMFMTLTGELS